MDDVKTIEQFIEGTNKALIANYNRLGLRASGQWAKELSGKFTETQTGYKITFEGSKYTQQLISGRRQNQDQSPAGIKAFVGWAGSTFLKDWVERKYKIAREGINVPNGNNPGTLLSDVFGDGRVDKLLNDITGAIVTEVRTDITKI